jgi:predicted RNA polymerase sigma factor
MIATSVLTVLSCFLVSLLLLGRRQQSAVAAGSGGDRDSEEEQQQSRQRLGRPETIKNIEKMADEPVSRILRMIFASSHPSATCRKQTALNFPMMSAMSVLLFLAGFG